MLKPPSKNVLISGCPPILAVPMSRMLSESGYVVKVVFNDNHNKYDGDLTCSEVHHDFSYSLKDCVSICEGVDFVIHSEGYRGNVGLDVFSSAEFFVKNTSMHVSMLEAARQNKVEKYVFASSCGSISSDLKAADISTMPSQVYGSWHKIIGESQCRYYANSFGMNITVLRFGALYGPFDIFEESVSSVTASAIRQICSNAPVITFWGDGSAVRDFIYSCDCARGITKALHFNACGVKPIELGQGKGVEVKHLVDLIAKHENTSATIRWDGTLPTGEKSIVMDAYTSKKYLGFICTTTLEEGLDKTIEWYKSNILK